MTILLVDKAYTKLIEPEYTIQVIDETSGQTNEKEVLKARYQYLTSFKLRPVKIKIEKDLIEIGKDSAVLTCEHRKDLPHYDHWSLIFGRSFQEPDYGLSQKVLYVKNKYWITLTETEVKEIEKIVG